MAQITSEEKQIYIVAGVLGGTCFLLLICIIVLLVLYSKLKRQLKDIRSDMNTWTQVMPEPKRILPRLIPEIEQQQQPSYFGPQSGRFPDSPFQVFSDQIPVPPKQNGYY